MKPILVSLVRFFFGCTMKARLRYRGRRREKRQSPLLVFFSGLAVLTRERREEMQQQQQRQQQQRQRQQQQQQRLLQGGDMPRPSDRDFEDLKKDLRREDFGLGEGIY